MDASSTVSGRSRLLGRKLAGRRRRLLYLGARIEVAGPYLRKNELQRFMRACVRLHHDLKGEALLETLEPNLKLAMSGNGRGRFHLTVSITPDHVAQQHSFEDEVDQTDLLAVISSLSAVLENFPTVGAPDQP